MTIGARKPKAELPFIEWVNDAGETVSLYPDVITSEQHVFSAQVSEHPVETGANVTDHYRVDPEKPVLVMLFSETPTRGDLGKIAGSKTYTPLFQPEKRELTFTVSDVALALAPVAILAPVGAALAGASIAASAGLQALGGAVSGLLGAVAGGESGVTALTFPEPPNRCEEAFTAFQEIMSKGYLVRVSSIIAEYNDMAIIACDMLRSAEGGASLTCTVSFQRLRFVSSDVTVALPIPEEPRAQGKKSGNAANTSALPDGPKSSVAKSLFDKFL